jgi:CheY-like chemotaxis protein
MSWKAGSPNTRVLVIDDDSMIRDLICRVLEQGHHDERPSPSPSTTLDKHAQAASTVGAVQVDTADSGSRGLDLVRQAVRNDLPYALVLVDMEMPPGWNGLETIRQIRSQDPKALFAICASLWHHEHAEQLDAMEMADPVPVLSKPFENTDLRDVVSSQISCWNAKHAAASQQQAATRISA